MKVDPTYFCVQVRCSYICGCMILSSFHPRFAMSEHCTELTASTKSQSIVTYSAASSIESQLDSTSIGSIASHAIMYVTHYLQPALYVIV